MYSELPYWWGRRRGRGNGGKCWGWDVLWGATVRTGNGRPGARDQEHNGAVALNALSDLIIGTLPLFHIYLFIFLSLYLFCLITSVCFVCTLSLLLYIVFNSLWVAWLWNFKLQSRDIFYYNSYLMYLKLFPIPVHLKTKSGCPIKIMIKICKFTMKLIILFALLLCLASGLGQIRLN